MSYPKKILAAIAASALIIAVGCGKDGTPDTALVPNDNGEGIATAAAETKVTLPKVRPKDDENSGSANSEDSTTTQIADADGNTASAGDEQTAEDNSPGDGGGGSQAAETSPAGSSPAKTSPAGSSPAVTAASGKTETTAAAQEDLYYLEGTVCENNGKTLLINETDLGKVSVSFKSGVKSDNIKVGDKVLITYNGYLLYSYPSQASGAYSVKVTEAADKSYSYLSFSKNDLSFSVLVPDDWSSKEIDYPTEGDFTDWGIRFTPEGQTGGLDISWHSAFSIREPYDIKPSTVNGNNVNIYSKDGVWRYYVYDNNFIAAASFYGSQDYSQYIPDMEFMLDTLEFV